MLVGYARVSSAGQSLEVQLDALRAAGCDKIFQEKKSGTSAEGRDALADALDFVRDGDTLMVTRLDRLARSSVDLHNIIERISAKGVKFRCLQQAGVDTDSGMGKLVLAILGAVAAFETDIRKERQREGIEKAKAKGVYKGRKPSVEGDAVRLLRAEGVGPSEIAKRLGIGRASVYRALKADLAIEVA
ncbi:MAG TPA: recombinase family protein [Novosphingobium sp.]|nr:recombinase family protein [Novosphingobium sp.]